MHDGLVGYAVNKLTASEFFIHPASTMAGRGRQQGGKAYLYTISRLDVGRILCQIPQYYVESTGVNDMGTRTKTE